MTKRLIVVMGAVAIMAVTGCSKSPKSGSTPAQGSSSAAETGPSAMQNMPGMSTAASTAEAVTANLTSALKSGNVSRIENAFSTNSTVQAGAVAAEAKVVGIKNQVMQLAGQKLGTEASGLGALVNKIAPAAGIFPTLASLKNNPIVVKGETAIMNQGKNLAAIYFSKNSGQWKVDLQKTISAYYPDAATAESKLQSITAGLGRAKDFLKQVESGLNAGTIKSFGDIQTLAAKFEASSLPVAGTVKNLLHF